MGLSSSFVIERDLLSGYWLMMVKGSGYALNVFQQENFNGGPLFQKMPTLSTQESYKHSFGMAIQLLQNFLTTGQILLYKYA